MHVNDSHTRLDPNNRIARWCKVMALCATVTLGLIGLGAANAYGHGPQGYGNGSYYSNPYYGGYSGYGYGGYGGYGGDPFHRYTGSRNHHIGPHSAPHVGTHYHWLHGYHNGLHWQRHTNDHSRGGHFGYRPWRPH